MIKLRAKVMYTPKEWLATFSNGYSWEEVHAKKYERP